MLNDITMGQYYPVDSPVHRLDPRTKLLITIGLIICTFLIHTLAGYILLLAFVFSQSTLLSDRTNSCFCIF